MIQATLGKGKGSDKVDRLNISYFTEDGNKRMKSVQLSQNDLYGWYLCDENDRQKSRTVTHHDGRPVKKIPSTRGLNKYRKIEFINNLPKNVKDVVFTNNMPKKTFADIEVFAPNEFPEQKDAKYPISSNCWCDEDGNVTLQGYHNLTELEIQQLEKRANSYLNADVHDSLKRKYKLTYLYYEGAEVPTRDKPLWVDGNGNESMFTGVAEAKMLIDYLNTYAKSFSMLFYWNMKFDIQYIVNRCHKLGIYADWLGLSPTKSTWVWKQGDQHGGEDHELFIPEHYAILDYMMIFDGFDRSVKFKTSMALDVIAEEVLGIKKVSYNGSLADLYIDDPMKFYEYAIVDPVLIYLIDKKLNTYSTCLSLTALSRCDYSGFHSASSMLLNLFSEYYYNKRDQVICWEQKEEEFGSYSGGYVREPDTGIHKLMSVHDFTSFFPSCMMEANIGVDTLIGKLTDDSIMRVTADNGTTQYEIIDLDNYNGLNYNSFDGVKQITPNEIVCSSGYVYSKDKKSSLSDIVFLIFNDRVMNKNMASRLWTISEYLKNNNDFGDYLEEIKALELFPDISEVDMPTIIQKLKSKSNTCKELSDALKVLLNSIYGVVGYKRFAFYHKAVAESVTTQSRVVIKHVARKENEYFENDFLKDVEVHKLLGIDGAIRDNMVVVEKALSETMATGGVVKYIDTDSIFSTNQWLYDSIKFKENCENGSIDIESLKVSKLTLKDYKADKDAYYSAMFVLMMDKHFYQPFYNKILHAYCVSTNGFTHMPNGAPSFKLGMEQVNKSVLWSGKKTYVKNPIWNEGEPVMPETKLEVKGLSMNKASFPKFSRDNLKTLVTDIMKYSNLEPYELKLRVMNKLRDIKDEIQLLDPAEVCITLKMNGYNKYCLDDTKEVTFVSGATATVKASAYYNYLLKSDANKNVSGKYQLIKSGQKIQSYTTTDPSIPAFGFPVGICPYEFAPPMDVEAQFQTIIADPLNIIFKAIGIDNVDSNLIAFKPLF
jgi:DNA polymerase elongation subunit (family B)